MEVGLTAKAFAKLLDRLGADREQAGEKYEDLRRTLTRSEFRKLAEEQGSLRFSFGMLKK